MGILDELLGGGQRQTEYRNFVDRYEQGHPSEGYSDQEVFKRYSDVSHAVPPIQYTQAAIEALGKLSPEERAAFVKMLQERAAAIGVALPRQLAPEPKELGEVLTDLHGKPGQLRNILGGGDAQPEGAILNLVNWVCNVICPVGAGIAVVATVLQWRSGRSWLPSAMTAGGLICISGILRLIEYFISQGQAIG